MSNSKFISVDAKRNLTFAVSNGTTFTYDAKGDKLKKVSASGTTDYVSGIQYTNGNIAFIQTEEGRAVPTQGNSYAYQYDLKDHLGNARATIDQSKTVTRRDDYYPFGLQKSFTLGANKYLYNGKEKQDELGGDYDLKNRFYDPIIGRFTTADFYSEFFPRLTTYQYAGNSPVSDIDLDGLEPLFFGETGLLPGEIPFESPVESLAKAGGELEGEPIQAPKTSSVSKFEWHHLIPQKLLKSVELIKEAIKEGFKFDGDDNLEHVPKYSKATGEGTHGNHPKYTDAIEEQLAKEANNNPGASASDILRTVANNARQAIRNNPDTNINDLFRMYFLVPAPAAKPVRPVITIEPLSPGTILPDPKPTPPPAPKPQPKPSNNFNNVWIDL